MMKIILWFIYSMLLLALSLAFRKFGAGEAESLGLAGLFYLGYSVIHAFDMIVHRREYVETLQRFDS